MSRDATKMLGGWIVVLGHLVILPATSLLGNLSQEQRRTIAWTLMPVLTVYFISLVKAIAAASASDWSEASTEDRTPAEFNVLLTSVLLPSILSVTTLFLIVSYPGILADTSDTLQLWIAGIEVAMAAAIGLVVDDLVPVTRSLKVGNRVAGPRAPRATV